MNEFQPDESNFFDELRADRSNIRYSVEDICKIIGISINEFKNFLEKNQLYIFTSIDKFTFQELVLLKKWIDSLKDSN